MRFLTFCIVVLALSSCNINSNIILKTDKYTEFTEPPVHLQKEYVIAPNDQLFFKFYKNNGFEMLGSSYTLDGDRSNRSESSQITTGTYFTVEVDGMVKLPYLGKVKLVGKTLREAEAFLESEYDDIFVQPFIILTVNNRRAIVSTGNGNSQVINLDYNNISVLEALSKVGGIAQRGKAKKIKLIRKTETGAEIYKLDLSTIDGIDMAYMPVQANDIIYVEPRKEYLKGILTEIGPYLTLLSTALTLYATSLIFTR